MEPQEWDYNEVLAMLSKQMGVELDDDDDDDDDESKMGCLGVSTIDVYFGGEKLESNPATQIHCDGPVRIGNINFNNW